MQRWVKLYLPLLSCKLALPGSRKPPHVYAFSSVILQDLSRHGLDCEICVKLSKVCDSTKCAASLGLSDSCRLVRATESATCIGEKPRQTLNSAGAPDCRGTRLGDVVDIYPSCSCHVRSLGHVSMNERKGTSINHFYSTLKARPTVGSEFFKCSRRP